MDDNKTIHQDLEDTAATVEDVIATDDVNDADMDETIDAIVDASDELELDDDEDNDDIDSVEGLEDEEIDIEAEDEYEAAEIELMSDIDQQHEKDSEEIAEEVEDDIELTEAYHLIDDALIESVLTSEDELIESI